MSKVYIQSDSDRTRPHHFDAACALYGAEDNGHDCRLTSYEEVASGKFDSLIRTNLFVGSTEFMTEVFNRIGKTNVRVPKNSNRHCDIITLKEAQQQVSNGNKLFIKPVQTKLFGGFVLDGMEHSCLAGLPDDTLVMAYKPFKHRISSEWRLYVHYTKVVDSRHYSGDFRIHPKYDYAELIARNNDGISFPTAYTLDIGILENGDNEIVEYNDMWAIGNYGIPNDLYYRLLKDRYFQIINNKIYG